MEKQVVVSDRIFKGLMELQDTATNMLDIMSVVNIATCLGHTATANWVSDNVETYIDGLFSGFAKTNRSPKMIR